MTDGGWKSVVTIIAIAVIAIAVGFLAGYSTKKVTPPDVVYIDVPVTVRDTIRVEMPPVSYPSIPAKPPAPKPDPVSTDSRGIRPPVITPTTACLDTMLKGGGEEYGRLVLEYHMPLNVFDLDFYPSPRKEITVTKYIYKKDPWYTSPVVTAAAGVVVGVAIERFR